MKAARSLLRPPPRCTHLASPVPLICSFSVNVILNWYFGVVFGSWLPLSSLCAPPCATQSWGRCPLCGMQACSAGLEPAAFTSRPLGTTVTFEDTKIRVVSPRCSGCSDSLKREARGTGLGERFCSCRGDGGEGRAARRGGSAAGRLFGSGLVKRSPDIQHGDGRSGRHGCLGAQH